MALRPVAAPVGAALAMWVLAACGSGGGPAVSTGTGTRDDPGTTRDTPPTTRDDTSGGSTGSGTPGGASCVECNVQYQCSGGIAQNSPTQLELSTSQGTCTQIYINLVCSGVLFGASGCSGGGGGAFTCGSVTCTPEAQQQPQPGQGQGGGASQADAG